MFQFQEMPNPGSNWVYSCILSLCAVGFIHIYMLYTGRGLARLFSGSKKSTSPGKGNLCSFIHTQLSIWRDFTKILIWRMMASLTPFFTQLTHIWFQECHRPQAGPGPTWPPPGVPPPPPLYSWSGQTSGEDLLKSERTWNLFLYNNILFMFCRVGKKIGCGNFGELRLGKVQELHS